MRIFVHRMEAGRHVWENSVVEHFERVPCTGEVFSIRADGPWYEVRLVVHAPFSLADFTAEVFAVECDRAVAISRTVDRVSPIDGGFPC